MRKNSLSASICLALLLAVGIIMSCSGGGGGGGVTNAEPVANAGPIQNVVTGSLVTLDGSVSSDANGDLLTYRWSFTSKPAGSTAVLSNSTVVNAAFTADKDGAYVLSLVVNDGQVDSTADTVTITAATLNSVPVANAGPDQNVATVSLVTLDGSVSSDANGDPLTYSWSFTSRPAGSSATLSNTTIVNPTFTADKDGTYVLSLIVNDGQADSTADVVTITAATPNSAPVANTGPDQNVVTGSLVTLDGSGSSDANGDPLTYSWSFTSRPAGSSATLSNTTIVNPTFTADKDDTYVLSLIVNDGQADSTADVVTITAATPNSAPVANAGPDQNVVTGSLVTLDGSGSSDANGDPLTYSWSFTSRPAGSSATLSNTTIVNPTFTADKDDTYVLSLIVNDGQADSTADVVTITAATPNSAPVADASSDQNVVTRSTVTLDGSGSSDANGDPLTYIWSFTSTPAGSTAVLSSLTVVSPTFTADKAGLYVLSLIVNDGQVDSAADAVTVTARNPCPDTGQTGDYTATFGEDSDYTINPPSYTDNGDGTIYDNVTGLLWQKCTNGLSGTGCATGTATTYNWFQATGTADATYNPSGATNICGHLSLLGLGWRLPTDYELNTIVDFGIYTPAINTTYFPATQSSNYWSSNTYTPITSYAWIVNFDYGYTTELNKIFTAYVRCVRGQ